jgi:uncharacterized membrane protein
LSGSVSSPDRNTGIDALRGLAVLLMVEQHLGVWLWNTGGNSLDAMAATHPLMLGFNALGGLAAPLFITLAGVGAALIGTRRPDRSPLIPCRRGAVIMALGYALNLLTPGWFSPGSWYVLHLIGFALILSPLLVRMPPQALLGLSMVILTATVAVQTGLNTPAELSNVRMRAMHLDGGIGRLALAEGQFPLLPWMALFATGIQAGRWWRANARHKILALAAACLCTGAGCALVGCALPDISHTPLLARALTLTPRIYPAYPPLILLLLGASLLVFLIATLPAIQSHLQSAHPLVCVGRTSLTILVLHILIFREGSQRTHLFHTFSTPETLIVIAAFIVLTCYLTRRWRRSGFRFSLEWLLRKIAG